MNSFHIVKGINRLVALTGVLIILGSQMIFAQDLPGKIRGYKVHKAKITVKTDRSAEKTGDSDAEALVSINDPRVTDLALTGITFEIGGAVSSVDQSGSVDFLTFHDFRVNGLAVDVAEYKTSFDLKKNEPVILPKPIEIFLSAPSAAKGIIRELRDSKPEWRVTGRVFVFGRFKKSIFKFKRVVPVDIDILIANPLLKAKTEADK